MLFQASAIPKEKYLKYREECFKSEKVPAVVIEKLNNPQYEEDMGHEAKCFIRCMALKIGSWDDTNGYNIDKTYADFQDGGLEVSKENMKKCFTSNPDNDDKCVWADKDLKCLYRNKYVTHKYSIN